MKLFKYKVNKFRSVKNTEWVNIDDWACYVGVNESGKTNLLLPLWKFNPASEDAQLDLLYDYPQDEYAKLQNDDDPALSDEFINIIFSLGEEDKKNIIHIANNKSSEMEEVVTLNIDEQNFILASRNFKGEYYLYFCDENGVVTSEELESIVKIDKFNQLIKLLPKFIYYEDYGNLDSNLYLPDVISEINNINNLTPKKKLKARTLKVLFKFVGLSPEEITSLGYENLNHKTDEIKEAEARAKQKRTTKLASASTELTKKFKEWWQQGSYTFSLEADGLYFRIYVSDAERPEKIVLESRSKGLQWFLSFYLVFLTESDDSHDNCILLLDEPGLSLHPNAQTDLVKFFHKISKNNQLIYTTHLPFLVDHNNLDKVKAVYTEKGITKISNDLSKADKEKRAIQPVNAAIGISASQSLLIGCNIVIVEGLTDVVYLNTIKTYLQSIGKIQIKRDLVFIPAGGSSSVKPILSILLGKDISILPKVILDSDKSGAEFKSNLTKSLYKGKESLIIGIAEITGMQNSEIEDLIPRNELIDCLDRIVRGADRLSTDNFYESLPIVPQIKQYIEDNDLGETLNDWKVQLSQFFKQRINENQHDQTIEKWQVLFEKIISN